MYVNIWTQARLLLWLLSLWFQVTVTWEPDGFQEIVWKQILHFFSPLHWVYPLQFHTSRTVVIKKGWCSIRIYVVCFFALVVLWCEAGPSPWIPPLHFDMASPGASAVGTEHRYKTGICGGKITFEHNDKITLIGVVSFIVIYKNCVVFLNISAII